MDDFKLHVEFEKKLCELFPRCGALIAEIAEIHIKKGQDYEREQNSEDPEAVKFVDYYQCVRDLWLQTNRKALRLKSLIPKPQSEFTGLGNKPNFESIRDNAMDLAAFAIWLAAWAELEEQERVHKGNS